MHALSLAATVVRSMGLFNRCICFYHVSHTVYVQCSLRTLLDVQNILSADTGISRQTEGHSFGDHLISEQSVLRHRV
jgi:hypothetical protein